MVGRRVGRVVSAAAEKVMTAFTAVMAELAVTDPSAWEPQEVIGFADGLDALNGIMQQVKANLSVEVSDGQGQ